MNLNNNNNNNNKRSYIHRMHRLVAAGTHYSIIIQHKRENDPTVKLNVALSYYVIYFIALYSLCVCVTRFDRILRGNDERCPA